LGIPVVLFSTTADRQLLILTSMDEHGHRALYLRCTCARRHMVQQAPQGHVAHSH